MATRSHGDDMLRPLPDDSATSIRPTRERLPVTGSSTSINWSTCLSLIIMYTVTNIVYTKQLIRKEIKNVTNLQYLFKFFTSY